MSTKTITLLFGLVLTLAIATGCAGSPGIDQLSGGGSGLEQQIGNGEDSQPGTGIQQDTGDDSAIDSSGTVYPPVSSAGDGAYMADSSQPGGGKVTQPVDWITYTDPQFGFSIGYPSTYVILDEIEKLSFSASDPIHRVRFMDAKVAVGPTASMEIPAFTIEIFENPSVIPLDSWISSSTPNASTEWIQVDGIQCAKVGLMSLQAPNLFSFCSRNNYIYKFTLVGTYAEDMLATFRFGN